MIDQLSKLYIAIEKINNNSGYSLFSFLIIVGFLFVPSQHMALCVYLSIPVMLITIISWTFDPRAERSPGKWVAAYHRNSNTHC